MFVPGDGIARMISWLKVEEFSWLYAILVLVIGAYLTWLDSRADLLDSAAYACTAMSPSIRKVLQRTPNTGETAKGSTAERGGKSLSWPP